MHVGTVGNYLNAYPSMLNGHMGDIESDFAFAELLARDSALREEVHESGEYAWVGGKPVRYTGPFHTAEDVARDPLLRERALEGGFIETDDGRLMEYGGPQYSAEELARDTILREMVADGNLRVVGNYLVEI